MDDSSIKDTKLQAGNLSGNVSKRESAKKAGQGSNDKQDDVGEKETIDPEKYYPENYRIGSGQEWKQAADVLQKPHYALHGTWISRKGQKYRYCKEVETALQLRDCSVRPGILNRAVFNSFYVGSLSYDIKYYFSYQAGRAVIEGSLLILSDRYPEGLVNVCVIPVRNMEGSNAECVSKPKNMSMKI